MNLRHLEGTLGPMKERHMNETRLRIMSHSDTSLPRGSAGIGRQAWLRTTCRKACGFKSHLPHQIPPTNLPLAPTPKSINPLTAQEYPRVTDNGNEALLALITVVGDKGYNPVTLPDSLSMEAVL